MKDMCAECGADLRMLEQEQEAGVAMVHAIPELKVPPVACLVSLHLQPPGWELKASL